ncbi:hypothetical protein CCHR01_04640 [Colletotrichum chrysophilum]|uniref:Uncharacterized protein n=1 Tax=Colletotrichum chrysophilum TaxID=1836956 RepID=A0AAD9AVR7_9PEZI|nr:hypothetical protein CCHR01_04640 [Colletotrichum chrysophilum]
MGLPAARTGISAVPHDPGSLPGRREANGSKQCSRENNSHGLHLYEAAAVQDKTTVFGLHHARSANAIATCQLAGTGRRSTRPQGARPTSALPLGSLKSHVPTRTLATDFLARLLEGIDNTIMALLARHPTEL